MAARSRKRSTKKAARKSVKRASKSSGARVKVSAKKTARRAAKKTTRRTVKKVAARPAKKVAKTKVTPVRLTAAKFKKDTATACDSKKSAAQRIAALEALTPGVLEDAKSFRSVLDILRDTKEAASVRRAALRVLQGASFSVVSFSDHRAEYIAALRAVVADKDAELRQRVLGILAREEDGYAQKLLLDGLKDPSQALLPPEKALQLLSYDVHAAASGVAREIVDNPPNPAARREALRVLSADASAAPMFEKILADKREPAEVRQLSAAALQSIAPKTLQSCARSIVLDDDEDESVRATSLTALTDLRGADAGDVDEDLFQRVSTLKAKSSSAAIKRTARRFVDKFKR